MVAQEMQRQSALIQGEVSGRIKEAPGEASSKSQEAALVLINYRDHVKLYRQLNEVYSNAEIIKNAIPGVV